jgi:hypothetical protein
MDEQELQSFFDLGNSPKRLNKHTNPNTIGEKWHGTKVYFRCSSIFVSTCKSTNLLEASMSNPYAQLHDGQLPIVTAIRKENAGLPSGISVIITGFNSNQLEKFTHDRIKDYVKWFTKFGSIELIFGIAVNKDKTLRLEGLDREVAEEILFVHFFPEDTKDIHSLFTQYIVRAPDYYCRKIRRDGVLKRFPHVKYHAIVSIEGNKVKQNYNQMLRRSGYSAPAGAYTVQERYGIWLCKDFIPVERRNEWITVKGTEFTRLHAFFNCQEFALTANRGSVANSDPDVLDDIRETVKTIYEEIIDGDDWREMDWLESEADTYLTAERERREFAWRKDRANATNIASLDEHVLVEPQRESGVYALLVQLCTLRPALFLFEIIDYDTHSGIDVIVKGRGHNPVHASALYYVELKFQLQNSMNHTFENISSIVCLDTDIKNGEKVSDLSGEERVMKIVPPDEKEKYTGYYLHRDRKVHIPVFVLRYYLEQTLGLKFRPRTAAETS